MVNDQNIRNCRISNCTGPADQVRTIYREYWKLKGIYRLAIYDEAKYGLHSRALLGLHKIVRHRAALVRMRTELKNKIHSVMFMTGTSISYVGTHSFTKGYIEKLKELNDYRINGYLRIIESLNDEINTVSKIVLRAQQHSSL